MSRSGRSSISVGHIDFFAGPDRRPLSGEIAIEQHFAVERMDSHRRTQRVLDAVDRSEREARTAIAEDDRRDDRRAGDRDSPRQGNATDVSGPPSTSTRRNPRSARLAEYRGRRDMPVLPPAKRRSRRPGPWASAPCAVTTMRRTPSSASNRAVGASLPRGSMTTRAGLGPRT